ncbi:MAG: glycosyltransferase [Prevotella sp.]
MLWTIIHTIDLSLWIFTACSVVYVSFYALIYIFHINKSRTSETNVTSHSSFLILFPAYNEDKVIVNSIKTFLKQDYPAEKYRVCVISDHQEDGTNEALSLLPITLLKPNFIKSSKAKALQHAIKECDIAYDYVVILDADNVVQPDFLSRLNSFLKHGYKAVQCHRCAKNSDSSVSILDGTSEEINNTLFRKAHNIVGLSSALIGSGMCFDYNWFKSNVNTLSTAGEDRELEVLLIKQNIFIKYAEHIPVFDEKVSNEENFQRQRQRWMSAQLNCLLSMLPYLPKALVKGNINFIDKTIQQMLIPRSMLVVCTFAMSLLASVATPWWSLKWWALFLVTCLSLLFAIPYKMYSKSIFGTLTILPKLTWKMLKNVRHIDHTNKEFLHTDHK